MKLLVIFIMSFPLAFGQIHPKPDVPTSPNRKYYFPKVDSISIETIRKIIHCNTWQLPTKNNKIQISAYYGHWYKNTFLIRERVNCTVCNSFHDVLMLLDTAKGSLDTFTVSHEITDIKADIIVKDTLFVMYNERIVEKENINGYLWIDLKTGRVIKNVVLKDEYVKWIYFYNNRYIIETATYTSEYNLLNLIISREPRYVATFSGTENYYFHDLQCNLLEKQEYERGKQRVISSEEEAARKFVLKAYGLLVYE